MSKKLERIWWVDDDPKRLSVSAKQRLETPGKAKKRLSEVKVQEVRNEQQILALGTTLRSAQNGELPTLIIIDQMLTNSSGIVRGSTLAVSLRAARPIVPIVGVTAVSFDDVAELQKDQFIEFFCIDDLQSGERVPDLYAIADGFRQVIKARGTAQSLSQLQKRLTSLLDCPTEDFDLLIRCLPGDFVARWDPETPHSFARWVWHTFTGRAGFLYDDYEAATMLGVSLSGFRRIEASLSGCEYRGAFASPARRRWWVSKIRSKLRSHFKADIGEPLWKLGRKLLPEHTRRDLSRCYGRKDNVECVPDTVAFADELLRERVQTRTEDTQPLESDTPPLGFEQVRVFSRS